MSTRTLALAALMFATTAPAQEPRAIIDKAIVAQSGSAAAQAKLARLTSKSRGTITQLTLDVPATRETMVQPPYMGRWAFELSPAAGKSRVTLGFNGLRSWRSVNGVSSDLSGAETDSLAEELHVAHLTTLLPLQGAGVTLAKLPDQPVSGKPAVGVKATVPGKPDVTLQFDAATYLLVRVALRGTESGVAVNREFLFAEHRPFDGVKLPTRETVLKDGKKVAEWQVETYSFPTSLPPATFAKP